MQIGKKQTNFLNVKDLNKFAEASVPQINNKVPLDDYFDECLKIFQKYNLARRQDNWEMSYIYLYIYTVLLLERIPKHKKFRRDHKRMFVFKRQLPDVLSEMELLKRVLKLHYNPLPPLKQRENDLEEEQAEEEEEERCGERMLENSGDLYSYDYSPSDGASGKKKVKLPPPPKSLIKPPEENDEEEDEETRKKKEADLSEKISHETAKLFLTLGRGTKSMFKKIGRGMKMVYDEMRNIQEKEKDEAEAKKE